MNELVKLELLFVVMLLKVMFVVWVLEVKVKVIVNGNVFDKIDNVFICIVF